MPGACLAGVEDFRIFRENFRLLLLQTTTSDYYFRLLPLSQTSDSPDHETSNSHGLWKLQTTTTSDYYFRLLNFRLLLFSDFRLRQTSDSGNIRLLLSSHFRLWQ